MKKKEYQKRLKKEKADLKELRYGNSGMNTKTFIIIAIGVVCFFLLMFAFTKIKTGEWNLFTKENSVTYTANIQDVKILCGSVLNRNSSEYFVLGYEMNEDNASIYETVIERYNNSSKKIPLYKLDLGNSRNNICRGESLNITNDITNLKLTVPTLLKIKDGKIIENYTDYTSIKNILFSYVD